MKAQGIALGFGPQTNLGSAPKGRHMKAQGIALGNQTGIPRGKP